MCFRLFSYASYLCNTIEGDRMSDNRLKFIDLFSGCGGMSLGFEQAGFECALAVDMWADALTTYQYNNPKAQILCADISQIDAEKFKHQCQIDRVDLIIGGPPCQGFSLAGKRIIDDERNSLYKGFVRFVAAFQPRAFVMENVPNILSIGGGVVKESIVEEFTKLGYKVEHKVLMASEYGVPQNRRRAFFVGLLNGASFVFPVATLLKAVTSSEALSDLTEWSVEDGAPYAVPAQSSYQVAIRQGSLGVFNHKASAHKQKTIDTIALVPDGGNYKDLPISLQRTRRVNIAWTRLDSQRPSFTIDTGHNHHFHYKYNRVPTVRESARLQSFPDTFIFMGSKVSQLKQVGNAVPPMLARAIAGALMKQID